MKREEALALAEKHTTNKNLIKHMLAVEAAMVGYAEKFGEDTEKWSVCGILHDFDYEKMGHDHPSPWGIEEMKSHGVDQEIIDAFIGHGCADKPETRTTLMAKALFAVDELTGLIVATALMKPNKLDDVDIDSVKRKMKDKAFAKGVNRDDIIKGAAELGVDIDTHISVVLNSMKKIKSELGL